MEYKIKKLQFDEAFLSLLSNNGKHYLVIK